MHSGNSSQKRWRECDVLEKLNQNNSFKIVIAYSGEEVICDLAALLYDKSLRISDSDHVLTHLRCAGAPQVPAQAASSMPDRV